EIVEDATLALERFDIRGFVALLDLCRDPEITDSRLIDLTQSAAAAAGNDPDRRSRIAEVLRTLLAQRMDQARKERQEEEAAEGEDLVKDRTEPELPKRDEAGSEDSGFEDQFDEEVEDDEDSDRERDEESDSETINLIDYLVEDLAGLADPLARDLIATAFDQGLVDRSY